MAAEDLEEVDTYVLCRQNTISQYITTCPILELCLAADQRTGEGVTRRWWGQGVLDPDWEGGRTSARAMKVGMEAGAEM